MNRRQFLRTSGGVALAGFPGVITSTGKVLSSLCEEPFLIVPPEFVKVMQSALAHPPSMLSLLQTVAPLAAHLPDQALLNNVVRGAVLELGLDLDKLVTSYDQKRTISRTFRPVS